MSDSNSHWHKNPPYSSAHEPLRKFWVRLVVWTRTGICRQFSANPQVLQTLTMEEHQPAVAAQTREHHNATADCKRGVGGLGGVATFSTLLLWTVRQWVRPSLCKRALSFNIRWTDHWFSFVWLVHLCIAHKFPSCARTSLLATGLIVNKTIKE